MVRQRRSIVEGLCTVCGEKTSWPDRWWFGLGAPIPGYAWATTEAPVHRACADLALQVCPHLRRIDATPTRFPAPDAVARAIVGGAATDQGFGVLIGNRRVVGHLKFIWKLMPDGVLSDGQAVSDHIAVDVSDNPLSQTGDKDSQSDGKFV